MYQIGKRKTLRRLAAEVDLTAEVAIHAKFGRKPTLTCVSNGS